MANDFKRKMEETIKDNFKDANSPILLIDGARQVGKSYVIRKMGTIHFPHFVEVNLINDKNGDNVFENVRNTRDFYFAVQSISGNKLGNNEDTLVFIDEIQERPELLTLLKFLRTESRYRYIVSGSLLGITLKKTSSIPIGSISVKRMYPMDFEEFLWANGIDENAIDQLRESIFTRNEVPEGIHRRFLGLFKDYLIAGGLPYCVDNFVSESDIVSLRDIQSEIHSLYVDDASKYDSENKLHTKDIYELIPSNIENKRKRIFVKDVENKENARFSSYKEDFDDLVSSGIVLKALSCANPTFRLLETAKRNLIKLYLADIGILTGQLYRYNVKPLRDDRPCVNLGNVYETVAAVELASSGHELYYYDNKKSGEVDFLIDDYDNLTIIPIEIKSGKDAHVHSAMDNLIENDKGIVNAYVLSNEGKIAKEGRITYLPIYSLMFL